MKIKKREIARWVQGLFGLLVLGLVYSCANIGSPNGGPYDETPPKFVSSIPKPNQLNYKGNKVEILFDELIQIEKPSENVIITPPQMEMPVIRALGRKVSVELKDTVRLNTTYTIDFTNSISDNNEKNIFENFSFAFSTGETIDSLEISGVLLNAENLEPMPGIMIGLHADLSDTAFVKKPFVRTSRTNDKGKFTIRNIASGSYHIFGLNDLNRDYKFDQPGEAVAFLDSVIVPSFEFTTRQDTLWKDTLTIDTIRTIAYTRFFPEDIELRLFKEIFERQYLVKAERPEEYLFSLNFNAKPDTFPILVPMNFQPADSSWFFLQPTEGGKRLQYWLADSSLWKQDTLRIRIDYEKSDSLNILRPHTDTLSLVMRPRTQPKKKRKENEKEPIAFLGMQLKASGTVEMFDTVSVTFNEPVLDIRKDFFLLEQQVDTLWRSVDFDFEPDREDRLKFLIKRPWRYEEHYRLTIDSAQIYSMIGHWNDSVSTEFKIRKEEEYGHLYLNLPGVDSMAFVELLNASDEPIRKAKVKDGGVLFMDLLPEKYYARLVLDSNGNNQWDTGKYSEKRQPEEVFYSPKTYDVMRNWNVEETWDIWAVPAVNQKPLEIIKNKPKEITKKKRNYKDESKPSSSDKNQLGGAMGLPF